MIHVHRDSENFTATIKPLRRAIPIVHINVDYSNFLTTGVSSDLNCDAGVVQEAVAISLRRLRVVTRWANERVGELRMPIKYLFNCRYGGSSGDECRVP